MKKIIKITVYMAIIILATSYIMSNEVLAQTVQNYHIEGHTTQTVEQIEEENAKKHFVNGEYNQAIRIYEKLLENNPKSISLLKMKAIALSNSGDDLKSLKEFYKIIQQEPHNVIALTGMGAGFGNLGEYKEASLYLEKAKKEEPDNKIIKNYKKIIDEINSKYPHVGTEKPLDNRETIKGKVPDWMKSVANWWGLGEITDDDFLKIVKYSIKNNVIKIPNNASFENTNELKMLSWVRTNLSEWGQGTSSDLEFFKNINWLVENKFIKLNKISEKSQEELDHEEYLFNKYLREIKNSILKEKRFIISSNPSQDVIKKFLRNTVNWNFEQQVKNSSQDFPDPTYEVIDETYIITYKIYINHQPEGLPLNHKTTLENTFKFWEGQELKSDKQNAKMIFEVTKLKNEASVWITWVIRDMGEGVLGHAHLGKGVGRSGVRRL